MEKKYVAMYASISCDKGCINNFLNVNQDHGVYKTMKDGSKYPIMNAKDMRVRDNISQFGKCIMTDSLCQPTIITPWFDANEANILEDGGMLTETSKLACTMGGIISIKSVEE
jgi:hypothetical protein